MSNTTNGFAVLEFKPYQKNSLQGFLDLHLPSGMVIHGCTYHIKNESRWIGFPAREYTKGTEKSWQPMVSIPDKDRREKFMDQAVAAIDEYLAAKR